MCTCTHAVQALQCNRDDEQQQQLLWKEEGGMDGWMDGCFNDTVIRHHHRQGKVRKHIGRDVSLIEVCAEIESLYSRFRSESCMGAICNLI